MSGTRLLQWLRTGNEVRVTEQETNLDVTHELLLKVVLHDQQRGTRFQQRCVARLDPHTGHGAPPAGTSVPGSAGEEAAAHPCGADARHTACVRGPADVER